MTDWNKPGVTDTYVAWPTILKDKFIDVATQFDGSSSTNIPTGAIKWDASASKWFKWNGSTWIALSAKFMVDVDTIDGQHFTDIQADTTSKVSTHDAVSNPHGSTSAATASKLVLRDSAGRAKVVPGVAAGDIATFEQLTPSIRGYNNLVVQSVSNTTISVTADEVLLQNSSGGIVRVPNVSGTFTRTGSASTDYFLWMGSTSTGTYAFAAGTSPTTAPSSLSSYPYTILLSFYSLDSGSNVRGFIQQNKQYMYRAAADIVSTVGVNFDLASSHIPSISKMAYLALHAWADSGTVAAGNYASVSAGGGYGLLAYCAKNTYFNHHGYVQGFLPLTGTNNLVVSTVTDDDIQVNVIVLGFLLP